MEHPSTDDALRSEVTKDRNDAEAWQDVDVVVKPAGTEVVSFRVPSALLDRIEAAAEDSGVSLSQFVRDAVEERLTGTGGFTPSAEVASSARQLRVYLASYLATFSEGLTENRIPDFPPAVVGGAISRNKEP